MKLNLHLIQIVSCCSQLVGARETNSKFGVGLSINDLNDIKKHFDQENQSKSKVSNALNGYNPDRNIYKNKFYNFSSKFSLEDRLLLIRLYNKYTEEHCMTFRTFAQKFKKKANEWINREENMWEVSRKGKTLSLLEDIGDFADLESLSENELLEILKSLDDEDISYDNLEADFEPDDLLESDIPSYINDTLSGRSDGQVQNQSQSLHAEIHTHNHYYLVNRQDGTVQVVTDLSNTDPIVVMEMLNSTGDTSNVSAAPDNNLPTSTDSTSTTSTASMANMAASMASSNTMAGSATSAGSDLCGCQSGGAGQPAQGAQGAGEVVIGIPGGPGVGDGLGVGGAGNSGGGGGMYGADQLSDQISLTTASPLQRPGTSTVSQTTLPPVEVPVVSNLPPVEVPAVSSLPADLPATIPTPVNRNGVFSCSTSSSGITTNFVNPSYPGYDSNTGLCKFYLILNSGVCQVRVDFVDTQLLSPVRGECSQQSLQVTGTIFPLGVNNFCGVNTDQHFYIETVSRGEASYVEFSVDTRVAANYKWGLWITQISCDGTRTIQAPTGCFQYYFDPVSVIQSFNYNGGAGQYFTNQHYRICILTASQACQIRFTTDGPFMLEKWGNFKTNPFTRAGVTSQYCVKDYLQIPGGFSQGGAVSHDRFCGGQLSSNHGASSSEPLVIRVRSRLVTLELHTGTPVGEYRQEHHKPGFRITYQQLACV